MKFKPWTPDALIDYYYSKRHYIDRSLEMNEPLSVEASKDLEKQKNDETALILKLATHAEMEKVWKELCKRTKRCERSRYSYRDDPGECERFMIIELIGAIQLAEIESKKHHSNRNNEIERYQAIADLAAQLTRAIFKTPLDGTVDEWFSHETINKIIVEDIDPEKLSGFASLISDEAVGETLIDSFFYKGDIFRECTNSDGVPRHEYMPREQIFQCFITANLPVLSEILSNIATTAKDMAENAKTKPRINERSNLAPATIFIRTLYWDFWRDEFGSPLYSTFASLCRVVLGDPTIDEDTIKNTLRSFMVGQNKGCY